MTELPEHLLKRAQARRRPAPATVFTDDERLRARRMRDDEIPEMLTDDEADRLAAELAHDSRDGRDMDDVVNDRLVFTLGFLGNLLRGASLCLFLRLASRADRRVPGLSLGACVALVFASNVIRNKPSRDEVVEAVTDARRRHRERTS